MGCAACQQKNPNITANQNINTYTMDKKEVLEKIVGILGPVFQRNVGGKYTSGEMYQLVQLHNEYFETAINHGNINDVKQCLVNLKALYYGYRNGHIRPEEVVEKVEEVAEKVVEEVKEIAATVVEEIVKEAEKVVEIIDKTTEDLPQVVKNAVEATNKYVKKKK